jgi:hypothetical protein
VGALFTFRLEKRKKEKSARRDHETTNTPAPTPARRLRTETIINNEALGNLAKA